MLTVPTASSDRRRGFTLVEVFFVLTLMTVLVAVGNQYYQRAIQNAKLARMKDDLKKMREGIERFHEMFRRYPKELRELEGKLLRKLPTCPFTGAADWTVDTPPVERDAKGNVVQSDGVYDVHCRLSDASPEGRPLKEY